MMKDFQEPVFFDTESTGLYPSRDQLLTIQVRFRGQNIIWKEWELGEKGIIKEFFKFTNNEILRKNTKFIGFNNLEHDIAFLNERIHRCNLYNQDEMWERFNRHLAFIDMRQLLGHSTGQFHKWRKALLGETYGVSGDMIPEFYKKGEYTKIINYITDELEALEKLYEMIKKEKFYEELQKLRERLS